MKHTLSAIAAAVLLLATICLFTTPIEDGDCFWHIATGQWILEHKTLPVTDSFTHTFPQQVATAGDTQQIGFRLTQYWLGQLALAVLWKTAGSPGIVLFRVIIYGTILCFLYRWIRKWHSTPIALLMVLPAAFIFRSYPNERPQLFSFLLMPLVLWLLEDLREAEKPGIRHWIGLPLAMLIWANCHGGYILGALLISIYLVTLPLKPTSGTINQKSQAAAVMIAALAASTLNPNGMTAFREILFMQSSAGAIQEFLSPFRAARELNLLFPPYWLSLALLIYLTVTRFKTIVIQHLLVFVLLAALSLTSLRYMPFLLMAWPLLAIYIPNIQADKFAWLSAIVCYALFQFNAGWRESFQFSANRLFPEDAVRFLAVATPAPELFNFYDWGGYIALKSRGVKTFTDGRALSAAVNKEYDEALWSGRWQEIFAKYRVNTVLIPAVSRITGATYPLATNLAKNSEWRLIFRDKTALIYVRAIPANFPAISKHSIDKIELQRHILDQLATIPPEAQNRVEYWLSSGNAHMLLGDYSSAGFSFKKALERDPGNRWAALMLRQTGSR